MTVEENDHRGVCLMPLDLDARASRFRARPTEPHSILTITGIGEAV
jgi:hypothetical protein